MTVIQKKLRKCYFLRSFFKSYTYNQIDYAPNSDLSWATQVLILPSVWSS